jgi:hypothetical protein
MTFIRHYEFQCEDNSRRLEGSPELVLNKEDGPCDSSLT